MLRVLIRGAPVPVPHPLFISSSDLLVPGSSLVPELSRPLGGSAGLWELLCYIWVKSFSSFCGF